MVKKTEVSAQLWPQIFERLAQDEYAALVDPDHDTLNDDRRMRTALARAGWTEAQIATIAAAHAARQEAAPVTSPGVSPDVEIAFDRLTADVESAMARLGLSSYERVARGVEPRLGPIAAKINVTMTDESIVTVGAFLFRYCGLIARAFTRTLLLDPVFWQSPDWDEREALARLSRQPALMWYWLRIQMSFAVTGTHILTPYEPSSPQEVMLMEQVARAMEIFAIAHEYGHHDLDHGRCLEADAKAEEFAADQFALRIGYEVERFPFLMESPYLAGGAGGVVLLLALENLREVGDIVLSRRALQADTHPAAEERISRFDTVAVLKPQEFGVLRGFRSVSARIMRTVGTSIREGARTLPEPLVELLKTHAIP
ncbi:hypothetical protein QOZ96_002643 [Brevundimonas nasdae]|uniref:hypothetical protein n=1 Tax=Brevundimonas nasdae TaxID=172043 RepID=UPI0019128C0D|nr:hypothetical protein [Brevundimonas nasdae]MBK6025862.1 hypothetical protein [Brevundimonas nasdae]MDQ0452690.1 hypothetical protein [Brevundimonas nasdae]